MATKVTTIELSGEILPLWGVDGYDSVRILVRFHGRPVGWASIPTHRQPVISADRMREAIAEQVSWNLPPVLLDRNRGAMRERAPLPPISVVVCTRDRPVQLRNCLDALLSLDYSDFEIIVVDSASQGNDTAQVAAALPVHYVREARPGLDRARNIGIAVARCDIIAFTDDDAKPDRAWLRALALAFEQPDVMAVTGYVAPSELETAAQLRFELQYGGMSHGFARRVVNRATLGTHELLWANSFGVGANMAFRREAFERIGLFDVALDVGTPSKGGGDVEMFHRLVAGGLTLVYEPAALVWHRHRRDAASLRRHMYDNGCAFGSYLLTCARNRSVGRLAILSFVLRHWLMRWLMHRLRHPDGFPRHLIVFEVLGTLYSPVAYCRARQSVVQR